MFSLIHKHGKEVDDEIYKTLSYQKSKNIEKLGLTLINDKENIVNGIMILMRNYKKDYKKLLINAFKKVKFYFRTYNPLINATIDFMYSSKKDLPDEILFYIYNKSYDSFCREYIIDFMKKRKLLTKELLTEMLHDADSDIRIKAKKWLKKTN